MTDFLKDKKTLIILLCTIFAAFVIRIIYLNSIPVFADEAIYVRWAQVMRADQNLRFLPLSDGKQPLFMWLTIPFLKVFSDPLFAGRFLSVLSGIGTLVGIFFLSKVVLNSKRVAILATILYAISPYSFFFDRMALVDSLLSCFGIWSVVTAFLTVKTLRLDLAMITGFLLGGALLTKSPALFFALLLPTLIIFNNWSKNNKENIRFLLKISALYLVIYLIGYGLYNILRLGPNFQMVALRNIDYIFPVSHAITSPFNPLIGHLKDSLNWLFYLGPFPLLLLLPFGIYNLFKQNKKALVILCLFILFPLVAQSEFAKVFTARYIFFTLPFLIVVASSAFLSESKRELLLSKLIVGLFVLVSFIQIFLLTTNPQKAFLPTNEREGYLENWTSGTGIKEVANLIRQEYLKDPEKTIVVGTEGYFGTLPDGLQIYLNDLTNVKVIGVGLGISTLPKPLSESSKSGNKTYLIINDSRLTAKPEEINLTKISSYEKALKKDGTHEHLLFLEVK